MSFVPDPVQTSSVSTLDADDHVIALVTARAWQSTEYRDRLVAEPAAVLAEAGYHLDPALELRVLVDAPGLRHVALTRQTTDPAQVADYLAGLLPVPRDVELRVVQSDDTVRHLVIAEAPVGLDATLEAEFALLAKTDPADTAQVKTNVEVVAEEAEAAVTTSEVAAEAFAVVVLT